MNEMISSVYIHIPFCRYICHYCDFTKFFYNEALATEYIDALVNEMKQNVPRGKQKVRTIYIGGGTPTSLNIAQLTTLFNAIVDLFDINHCEEFTIEANPGDIDPEKIQLLRGYGVNRFSLGVQVFDDEMLRELGRAHTVKDVYETVHWLKQYHYDNISIDLIYSLPHQTVDHFQHTIDEALSFDLPHYSSYSLQIEPKTIFYNRHKKGQLHRPPHEDEVEMYMRLQQSMHDKGLIAYEISNFAKPGYESKHNLTYWSNDYYYGFGAGAHGYLPGKRTGNIRPLPAYIKQAMKDGQPVLQVVPIGLKEKLEEEFFLGLRKLTGVDKKLFQERYGFSYDDVYRKQIDELIHKGWLAENASGVHLTEQGRLFGNDVFEKFLLDEEDLNHLR